MVSVQDPVTNFATESIIVYPNPARDVVMIQFDPPIEIKRLQLLNTLGQATWSEERITTSSEHTRTIPVGALQQGVYVLAIETNVGWMRKKVVIQ